MTYNASPRASVVDVLVTIELLMSCLTDGSSSRQHELITCIDQGQAELTAVPELFFFLCQLLLAGESA